MDNKLVYLVGPTTNEGLDRLRQLLPKANIELRPYPNREKKTTKAGATVVLVFDDYVGIGKELLLVQCLQLKPSRLMGLNKEGELISLSKSHVWQLFLGLISRLLLLPIRFSYVCAILLWAQISGLPHLAQPEIKLNLPHR